MEKKNEIEIGGRESRQPRLWGVAGKTNSSSFSSSSQRRNKVGLRAGVPERGEGLDECECERCKSGE
jgi:hypothetical protein